MSWDVVLFNLNKKVTSVEEINEEVLIDIGTGSDFKKILNDNFTNISWDDNCATVDGNDYSLVFYNSYDNESFSNTIVNLYGEKAVYAVIALCKKYNWQAFDTGLGEMLNLDHPEKNGYQNFQSYLAHVINNGG